MPNRHAKDWDSTECRSLGQRGKGEHLLFLRCTNGQIQIGETRVNNQQIRRCFKQWHREEGRGPKTSCWAQQRGQEVCLKRVQALATCLHLGWCIWGVLQWPLSVLPPSFPRECLCCFLSTSFWLELSSVQTELVVVVLINTCHIWG